VSLLWWRSGGVEHPHDTSPYPFMPSPTSAHSSAIGLEASPSTAHAKLGLGAEHKSSGKTVVSTTSSEVASHIRVKARPNLMWEISDSAQFGQLDGTYIHDESLCRVRTKVGANAKVVSLIASAKQRDIVLHLQQNNTRLSLPSTNHEKMLKVLIAKTLSASKGQFNGIIELSKSETDIED
ncbi:MAG: hypothetical protein WA268_25450, partial [Xanthobacteraceae bacterium]